MAAQEKGEEEEVQTAETLKSNLSLTATTLIDHQRTLPAVTSVQIQCIMCIDLCGPLFMGTKAMAMYIFSDATTVQGQSKLDERSLSVTHIWASAEKHHVC